MGEAQDLWELAEAAHRISTKTRNMDFPCNQFPKAIWLEWFYGLLMAETFEPEVKILGLSVLFPDRPDIVLAPHSWRRNSLYFDRAYVVATAWDSPSKRAITLYLGWRAQTLFRMFGLVFSFVPSFQRTAQKKCFELLAPQHEPYIILWCLKKQPPPNFLLEGFIFCKKKNKGKSNKMDSFSCEDSVCIDIIAWKTQ